MSSLGLDRDVDLARQALVEALRAEIHECGIMLTTLDSGPVTSGQVAKLMRCLSELRGGCRIAVAAALGRLEAWQGARNILAQHPDPEPWQRSHANACPVGARD